MTDSPDQGGSAPQKPPRKKPGPPKGVRYGGKKKGTKNKKTLERERAAQLELERARMIEAVKDRVAAGQASEADRAVAAQHKLMKDIGMDMTRLAAGLAAFYQPHPTWTQGPDGKLVNGNPNYDEPRFRYYLDQAMSGARDFAAYESPKLSAVMVGQQVVNDITVRGGMPDEFQPPAGGDPGFKPGDIVSAEESVPLRQVVNGEIIPLPVKTGTG